MRFAALSGKLPIRVLVGEAKSKLNSSIARCGPPRQSAATATTAATKAAAAKRLAERGRTQISHRIAAVDMIQDVGCRHREGHIVTVTRVAADRTQSAATPAKSTSTAAGAATTTSAATTTASLTTTAAARRTTATSTAAATLGRRGAVTPFSPTPAAQSEHRR